MNNKERRINILYAAILGFFRWSPPQNPGKTWIRWIMILLLLLLISIPLFYHLDRLVVRLFDESRNGVNAYEMMKNGHLFTKYYDGNPDLWNTKPPLLIWMQASLMKLIGPGELALRLPAAISAFLTLAALLIFSARFLKSLLTGCIWAMVLVTANGYVDLHGARTGDFDSLLTLFMTLSWLFFFLFLEKKKLILIYATAAMLALAVLTKGIAGLFFLPGMFLYILLIDSGPQILRNRHTYFAFAIFILIIGIVYIAQENAMPGYLKAVWQNELSGRYFNTIEQHRVPFLFYYDGLKDPRFFKWLPLLIPGLLAGWFSKDSLIKKLTLFTLILGVTFFMIISFAETKQPWYDLPLYPLLALFIANFIAMIFSGLHWLYERLRFSILIMLSWVFILSIFYEPYRLAAKEAIFAKEHQWDVVSNNIAYFLRDAVDGKRDLDDNYLAHDGYQAQCLFYLDLLKDQGQNINFKDWKKLRPGDRIIAHQNNVKGYITTSYPNHILEQQDNVVVYEILRNE